MQIIPINFRFFLKFAMSFEKIKIDIFPSISGEKTFFTRKLVSQIYLSLFQSNVFAIKTEGML